jgi:hypothetical protein
MSLKDAKKAFYDAKKELEQLEAELPNFVKLLDDNKHAEQKLRGARAKTENLLDARSRSHAAKELLEQHHADLETQRAEVARLEDEYQRERAIDKMVVHAKAAYDQRQAFDAAITQANEALGPLVNRMINAWDGWKAARSEFVTAGRPLSRGFGRSSWGMTTGGPDDQRILAELLADLEDRGAPLDDALSPHDGWDMTVADLDHFKPLARPEPFAYYLYEMMKHVLLLQEQAAHREAHRRKEQEDELEQPPSVTSAIFVSQEHGVEALGRLGGAMGGLVLNSHREPSGRATLTVKNEHLERCLDVLKRHLPEGTFSVPGNGA